MQNEVKPGARLRAAREAAGFSSARQAAQRMGWSETTYTQHESGTRGLKQSVAETYAKAFGVDAAWILFGSGRGPTERPHVVRPQGFSESDVMPISELPSDRQRTMRQIARAVRPGDRHPAYYVMGRSRPDLLLAKGDLLILDLGARASDGDVVILQMFGPTGEAETQIRRMAGGVLVGGYDDAQALSAASADVAIRGVVAATVRENFK